MIKVGQKVRFNPFKGLNVYGCTMVSDVVDGVVKYIHPTNHWFSVEYEGGGGLQRTSYKFDDIGRDVKIVKS